MDSARFLKVAGRHAYYELVLRPWLHLATRTSDCKIFHDKTVVQILDEVLADYPFPVEKRLGTVYPERETQTQLNETDADFLLRLCQEWGINFHFEHSEGKHRLVLCDTNEGYRENPSEAYRDLRFHDGRNQIDEEFVSEFTIVDIHRMLDADVPTSTSHVIHFVGGGFFSFLMDGSSKILETMERDVITSVNRHTGVLRLHGSRMPDDLQGKS